MSSCFNLRLPRPNKAWKSFTSKLRTKLHKLHNPKSIKKKPKHISSTTLTYPIINPAATAVPYSLPKDRKTRRGRLVISLPRRGLPFKRKSSRRLRYYSRSCTTAPVFVDKLFVVEPPIMEVLTTTHCEASSSGKSGEEGTDGGGGADDMWESLGYESPLMRGIDERAEEFISSFRAEMQVQERMIALRSL
ncbi:hypothetical protein LINGRAHAP2_LOCUS15277 [Linum grandiflorum]